MVTVTAINHIQKMNGERNQIGRADLQNWRMLESNSTIFWVNIYVNGMQNCLVMVNILGIKCLYIQRLVAVKMNQTSK